MMDIGAPELLVILVILILIMGPGKLAGLGGSLGKSIREFRQAVHGNDEPAQPGAERATSTITMSQAMVPAPAVEKHDTAVATEREKQ